MAPTEAAILRGFLFSSASLENIMSLEEFTDLFPDSSRSKPHIRHLFHELQQVRDRSIEKVRQNISKEVKRGERQKRQIAEEREKVVRGEAVIINAPVLGAQDMNSEDDPISAGRQQYTISNILPDMERACRTMEAEIAASEAETASLVKDIKNIVGGLSDLRYGRFSKPPGADLDLREVVLDELKGLYEACIASGEIEA